MLKAQGLEARGILPGDVVYIYTGWGDGWADPDTEKSYYSKGPGLAADAAAYLAEQKVVLIALDNPFTDAVADGQLAKRRCRHHGSGLPFVFITPISPSTAFTRSERQSARDRCGQVWTSCTMILPLRSRHAGA
jgi:hypothetical protein